MIISRTPFRVSFAGGGTDLPAFYMKEPGCVTSTTINKYMYITIHRSFDNSILLKYSRTENVKNVDELIHTRVREAMKMTGVLKGVEITSVADIPAGTGLGSSCSFTVGILNALYAYKDMHVSAERLAKEACDIEIGILKEPIGKQDQYAAAYGGLQHIQFNPDGSVFHNLIICKKSIRRELDNNLLMFYTGMTRSASAILKKQSKNTKTDKNKFGFLVKMRDLARDLRDVLSKNDLTSFGEILHKGWMLKKQVAGGISNPVIDKYYNDARKAGALGGKILGAGGGGFLLLYVEEPNQEKVRDALFDLREMPFELEPQGSKIIYVSD